MTLPVDVNQNTAIELRQRLEEDTFFKQLCGTTLFGNIPPTQMSLATLEELSLAIKLVPLDRNEVLNLKEPKALYEIISGYVKIYDRGLHEGEKEKKDVKNPRALLAWRVPGELLGDFQFSLPNVDLSDQIVATDDCLLLGIPSDIVRSLAQRHPQIYLNLAGNLAAKAIKARIRAQILRLPNIESMIAKMFIELIAERHYDDEISRKKKLSVLNGSFHVDDIAAFLGYEYHRTQMGIRALIDAELIDHYLSNKSGRFTICSEEKLHSFLEQEQ